MNIDEVLFKIRDFADEAHDEQLRKYSGERYIVHPVRVMEICKSYTDDIAILASALLHDVLEDTQTSEQDILIFLNELIGEKEAKETVKLVVDLTDVYIKDNFPDLNRKTRKSKEVERLSKINARSQTVKYADIIDNSLDISKNDIDFASVYLKEMYQLLLKMNQGHPELYSKALETVDHCLKQIITTRKS